MRSGSPSSVDSAELTGYSLLSPEPFFCQALHAFLRLFPFQDLALDVALRVFLCSAALPTETQHIDRVMEAFARRYCECNPGIFGGAASKREVGEEGLSAEGTEEGRAAASAKNREGKEESDVPYVLAFSMVMLNTDHFNPNAKTKMFVFVHSVRLPPLLTHPSTGPRPTTSRTLAWTALLPNCSR